MTDETTEYDEAGREINDMDAWLAKHKTPTRDEDFARVAELRMRARKALGWKFRYVWAKSRPRWGINDAQGNRIVVSADADEVERIVMAAMSEEAATGQH